MKTQLKQNFKSPYQIMQTLAIAFVISMLSGMWYVTHVNERLSLQYTAWVNAVNGIAIEGTAAHLWFEEIVSGDTGQDIHRDVWAHLDRAEAYTQGMLKGGQINGIVIPKLESVELRHKIEYLLSKLVNFRAIAEERYRLFRTSSVSSTFSVGNRLDQKFDGVFQSFIQDTESFKLDMQQHLTDDFDTFRKVQYSVMFMLLLLSIVVTLALRYLDAQREQHARKAYALARFSEENPNPVIYIDANHRLTYANKVGLILLKKAKLNLDDLVPASWQASCEQTKKDLYTHDMDIVLNDEHYSLSFMQTQEDDVHVFGRNTTELNQSKSDFKSLAEIIEKTTDLVAVSKSTGQLSYMNPAGRELLGIPLDENLKLKNIADFHSEKENKRIFNKMLPKVIQDKVWNGESLFLHRNGEEIPMSIVLLCNQDALNQSNCFSVIARDLREEKSLQSKIEHTQRLESLGVLAGGIAHDFNNILTAIMGNAGMAEHRLSHAHPAKEHLSRIIQASDKAAQLCKQMLAYSGKGRFVIEHINLNQLVEDMVSLLEVSIAKNVVIRYELSESIPNVEVDIAQMQQIVMNLITNASEAIEGKSGVVTISSGVTYVDKTYLDTAYADEDLPAGTYVSLEVSDNGCGMTAQVIKKIFDPFFTTKFTGRGLGMSAVLGIIRGHHGVLKVYSEAGRGSTFKMLLPALSNKEVSLTQPSTSDSTFIAQVAGTALVVDDDEVIRDTAAAMLREIGFNPVLTAENGLIGVETYKQHQQDIQIVLLDMTMPKLDGEGTFRELRRVNPDVKVILSSGYNEQEATQRFTGKGLAGFIQKPYLPDSLQTLIHNVLSKDNHS